MSGGGSWALRLGLPSDPDGSGGRSGALEWYGHPSLLLNLRASESDAYGVRGVHGGARVLRLWFPAQGSGSGDGENDGGVSGLEQGCESESESESGREKRWSHCEHTNRRVGTEKAARNLPS